jgi:NAD-dependent deacetylase
VPEVSRLAELFRARGPAVVLTGAGISTESGIPDFRSPTGIWAQYDPAEYATIEAFRADPLKVWSFYSLRLRVLVEAEPNDGHRALAELERAGHVSAVVTQNIDGLHQRAGSDPSLVIEIHGTVWQAQCLTCAGLQPMSDVLTRVDTGDEDPACLECGGLLKSATVSFGQALRADVWRAAVDAATDCDLFLAIGSSLQVHPAASLCDLASGSGARLVVVNAEPTPYDSAADAVVRAPISTVLPALVEGAWSESTGTVNPR